MGIVERLRLLEKRVVDLYNKIKNLPSGGVQSVTGGSLVNNTDPSNPTIVDAPSDGTQYARKDGEWEQIVGGDFIPLSGTEPGSPVSGDIEFLESTSLKFNFKDIIDTRALFEAGSVCLKSTNLIDGKESLFIVSPEFLFFNNTDVTSRGIASNTDFTPNITDLDYVQKKYVDEQIAASSGGANYKVYTALLTQSGTNDPVATVLEDTLDGTITWNRDSTGDYYAVYSDNFPSGKVLPFVGGIHGAGRSILFKQNNSNSIELATWDASNVLADSMFSNLSIEIRVYN